MIDKSCAVTRQDGVRAFDRQQDDVIQRFNQDESDGWPSGVGVLPAPDLQLDHDVHAVWFEGRGFQSSHVGPDVQAESISVFILDGTGGDGHNVHLPLYWAICTG